MPEPQDIAALREAAEAATPGPWECDETSGVDDLHWGHIASPVIEPMGYYGPRLNDARHIAAFDPPTVLALLSEAAEGRALRAAVEALAEEFDSNVDWSAGRNNYGDNQAWESAARQARGLLLAAHIEGREGSS